MITAIQQLATELPLQDHYNWEMPATLPIEIPPDVNGSFERSLYLKQHLNETFDSDSDLQTSLWIIQDWGGIKTFKNTAKNRNRIETFYAQLQKRRLTKDTHDVLSSLSNRLLKNKAFPL